MSGKRRDEDIFSCWWSFFYYLREKGEGKEEGKHAIDTNYKESRYI